MIDKLFIQILNMSLTAGAVIIAVLLVRVFLRKAPRIFSYALWAIVLFRLLCPFSFSTAVSLFGAAGINRVEQGRMIYIPEDIDSQLQAVIPVPAADGAAHADLPRENVSEPINLLELAVAAASRIWLCGAAVMLGYSFRSLQRFRKKLKGAVFLGENIYAAEGLPTPFVIGFFRPKIYLPSSLKEEEKEYVLLHERIHIKRGDPAIRIIGYLALCLHWFNPLVWIAYRVSGRDMEMSCDEAVIKKLGVRVKKKYTASLLNFAAGREVRGGAPLAFGERNTGKRIKNVLHYKKPAFWAILAAAVVCAAVAIVLISNPADVQKEAAAQTEEYQSYYGVLKETDIEGTMQRVVIIPGIGDVYLPDADEIYPWFETEHFELEVGDLVKIDFPKEKEVEIQETYPASFSAPAAGICAIMRNLALEYKGEDRWLFSFPKGILPQAEIRPGDMLKIAHQTAPEENGYFQPSGESEESAELELVGTVQILAVTEGEVPCVTIELTTQQMKTVLENLGFRIYFSWEAAENTGTGGFEDGTYEISVRTVSVEKRVIDSYVGEDAKELAFAQDCAFTVNYEMAGVQYEEVSFDTFAELTFVIEEQTS